jgi:hypothetical protein
MSLSVSVSMDTDTDRDMDVDVDMGRFLQLNGHGHGQGHGRGRGHGQISLVKFSRIYCRCMRHISTALYFYGASKKTLHKPSVTFGNILFKISYSLDYYLQLLC